MVGEELLLVRFLCLDLKFLRMEATMLRRLVGAWTRRTIYRGMFHKMVNILRICNTIKLTKE